MYQSDYSVPQSNTVVYDSNYQNIPGSSNSDEDRFILAPLLVGGLAGGAIGYGLGVSRPYPVPMPMPMPMPMGMGSMNPMMGMPMSSPMMPSVSCNNNCFM